MYHINPCLLYTSNIRIIESVAKRLKQPMDKFPTNLQQCGNISAARVPILLDKVRKDGMIKHEEKIILSDVYKRQQRR